METQWKGNVRDLVNYVAGTDARETVIDAKTGAKIRINVDGVDYDPVGGRPEPFYIESPDGENFYDAYNRKEAVMILSNIRKGKRDPDTVSSVTPKRKKQKPKGNTSPRSGVRGLR